MENPTAGVNNENKSPDQIEREMEQTRESITEKVSLLENQVKGTIDTTTHNIQSVKDAVTGTVEAVKDAVASAPATVSETVKQTFASVKESVRETVSNLSVTECVRDNPWGALGTSTLAGFLTGYLFLGGSRSSGGLFARPIMARGDEAPAPRGAPGTAHGGTAAHAAHAAHGGTAEEAGGGWLGGLRMPGFLDDLFGMASRELRAVAEQALNTAVASLKQSISTQVPQAVNTAVNRVTERVTERVAGASGTEPDGTTRVSGPAYGARSPAPGL